ncbi:MAG: tRNA (adenosine(37)-N6)-threonylcarbamoyltransferase complex transferase subunit TsaD [Candidatus Paceibacterota bacterium]|jgi:N6-L-threonylcarbamoyladenine synthase
MNILGIETSCDETAIALVEFNKQGTRGSLKINILADKVASQIKTHEPFGGVVPGLAAREHIKNLPILFKETKRDIEKIMKMVDLIAITHGPGLMPCLLVGVAFAKALAYKYQKPIIGTNHLDGHLYSGLLSLDQKIDVKLPLFPAIGLIVSGGHTELILINKIGSYKLLGETLDDAAGEAFDKVARLLGLGYPGGPIIEKIAKDGNPRTFDFPRPMINSGNYNFSFAGLKTAVLYKVREIQKNNKGQKKIDDITIKNLAASFQQSVIDTLIAKLKSAIIEFNPKSIFLGGGVLANQALRDAIGKINLEQTIYLPQKRYCGDNASIIALAAYFNSEIISKSKNNWKYLEVNPNLVIN